MYRAGQLGAISRHTPHSKRVGGGIETKERSGSGAVLSSRLPQAQHVRDERALAMAQRLRAACPI